MVVDSLWEELKMGFAVTMILQQFPAVTSGYGVLRAMEEFIPSSTRKAFNQFEKFDEISCCDVPEGTTDQASKFWEQTGESILDSLEQFNVLDVVWIGFQTDEQ